MEKRASALTGACGVHFVASRLAFENFHAAITFGNAPMVDILVSRADGAASLALQVKTTASAIRTRGRGEDKHPVRYEWDTGEKAARKSRRDLLYAFVDLKDFKSIPDVFIVPSSHVVKYFKRYGKLLRYRFHPTIAELEPFKNAWSSLRNRLDKMGRQSRPSGP